MKNKVSLEKDCIKIEFKFGTIVRLSISAAIDLQQDLEAVLMSRHNHKRAKSLKGAIR
jgi:hypothetical protein